MPSSSHRPRKRFGQHFLHEAGVVARILEAIAPQRGESIVEIGSGEGVLTRSLLERAGALHVVEIDRDLAARQAIRQRKSEDQWQEWVRQQRDKAYVEYHLDDK